MISIIIPVLNEAARIAALLRHTAALAGDRELIVVDGGSADGT
ncbi:MAG: glycosyltransferase, partial [Chloroflexales bacterium]|nr:glycosyltransferase [Chloroflexales bacterium]